LRRSRESIKLTREAALCGRARQAMGRRPLLLLLARALGLLAAPARTESESYASLAERAGLEFKQQRCAQAEPLLARCGDAARAAGDKTYAAGCYNGQASNVGHLNRDEEALVAATKATDVDGTDWGCWSERGDPLGNLGPRSCSSATRPCRRSWSGRTRSRAN